MRASIRAADKEPWRMPWRWVLVAGTVAAVLTFVLQRLIIFGYVYGHMFFTEETPTDESLNLFAAAMGLWGMSVLHSLLALLAAFWEARRSGVAPVREGLAVGVVAAVANQAIMLVIFPPVRLAEAAQFLVLGMAAGSLGGYLARRTLDGRESLYRASRAVGTAQDPRSIAAAIGEHLAAPATREIGVWGIALGEGTEGPAEFVLLGVWSPQRPRDETLGNRLGARPGMGRADPVEGSRTRSGGTLHARDLTASERAAWEAAGVRSVFVLPLTVPGERVVGLLSVASRSRLRPSGGAKRAYQTVGAQAALALENSRLAAEARRMGREAGVMRERQRLAREIHDTLAQGFTSVVMHAQAAEAAVADDPDAARAHHEQIVRTAREGLSEARRMVWALRPVPLDGATLPEALAALARGWSEEDNVAATAEVTGNPRPLRPEIEVTLLRVAQESLANVRKHARASRAALTLSYMPNRVSLDACDDGVGFDPEAPGSIGGRPDGSGFGLAAMRERVALLGGKLTVESAPGEGTTIVAELPADANGAVEGLPSGAPNEEKKIR